jgi:hypothetical protein
MARGKRLIKVAPVAHTRDPESVASLTLVLGSGGSATAHLTEAERRTVIEALGGELR